MSPLAYLRAFWHGDLSGPAEWLAWAGVVVLGIALGMTIAMTLGALVDYLARHEDAANPDQVPPELDDWTPTERRARSRTDSLLTVLAVVAVPVIALTR